MPCRRRVPIMPCDVQRAHAQMIDALTNELPHFISVYNSAESVDLKERAEHIAKVIETVKRYLGRVIEDTCDSAMIDSGLNRVELLKSVDDTFGYFDDEITGMIRTAAERMESGVN